jgi:two-component system sensor histidine kinase RegB
MRVSLTGRRELSTADLRPAGELAPSLALPWIVRLRYGVLAGQAFLILLAHFVFDVRLPLAWLALPLAVTGASNPLLYRLAERLGARPALGYSLALDTLCLTALLALTGGPANPFSLLYLVQITLSAVVLSKAWTWGLGILSVACFAFLFWAHAPLEAFEGHHTMQGFSTHLVGMWVAFAAAALLITIFIGRVSEVLREKEQEVLLLQDQLARHERLASIVTLAAGAAHELGTPLATIAIASREMEASEDAGIAEDARLIRSEVERCSRILQRMSARGAEPVGEAHAAIELAEFLGKVRGSFPAGTQQRLQLAPAAGGGTVRLPVEAARQALAALVDNAIDASAAERPVRIAAERTAAAVRFTVADSGCGMSPATLKRLSEPFFTTKPPGAGMGLGTFLARVFAERLGGTLAFESEPGKGTTAILELPSPLDDEQGQASSAPR